MGPRHVSFPTRDGGVVHADVYGEDERAVVLAHGGRFNKESWSAQAQTLVGAGFRVIAIDFRGRGQSRGGPGSRSPDDGVHFDVLAATVDDPEQLTGRKLFILTREDVSGGGVPRLPEIREQCDHAPDPKELVILEGSAHAQFVFEID